MKAEELIRLARGRVEVIFASEGKVLPMCHYVTDEGHHVVIPSIPSLNKDQWAEFLRWLMRDDRAVACVLIDEAWAAVAAEKDEWRRYGSVKDMPERYEIVMMLAEDSTGVVQGFMKIIRPDDGPARLGELEMSRPTQMEGRFIGLLPSRGE